MPALRASELPTITEALRRDLQGGRVRSVRQRADDERRFVLELRTPGQNHWLELAATAPLPHLLLRDAKQPAPTSPAPFTMLLRKHVEGLALLAVDGHPLTWLIELCFGLEAPIARLIIDLHPQRPNLFLTTDSYELLGSADVQSANAQGHHLRETLRIEADHSLDRAPARDAAPALAAAPTLEAQPREDLWAALRARFDDATEDARRAAIERSLRRRLQRARKRAQRTLQNVEKDLARVDDIAALREEAELLQSARHLVKRGDDFVDVPDWNDPEMRPRRITLDPSLSLQQEVERRFRRYRRLKDAELRMLERLEEVEAQARATEDAFAKLASLDDEDALTAFARELERARLIPREDQQRRVQAVARQPYHEARSSDGYRILVGRNAKDNDTLTLRIARGRDLWLHARESAGSHVIIWMERAGTPPPRTLFEAATLAATNSTAKKDTRVDVGYTERKHVSKPPGSPPGRVNVASMKTLLVAPDEALCAELFERARAHRAQDDERSP